MLFQLVRSSQRAFENLRSPGSYIKPGRGQELSAENISDSTEQSQWYGLQVETTSHVHASGAIHSSGTVLQAKSAHHDINIIIIVELSFVELYTQRLIEQISEGNIDRLTLSWLRPHRLKLHRLRLYRLRPHGLRLRVGGGGTRKLYNTLWVVKNYFVHNSSRVFGVWKKVGLSMFPITIL